MIIYDKSYFWPYYLLDGTWIQNQVWNDLIKLSYKWMNVYKSVNILFLSYRFIKSTFLYIFFNLIQSNLAKTSKPNILKMRRPNISQGKVANPGSHWTDPDLNWLQSTIFFSKYLFFNLFDIYRVLNPDQCPGLFKTRIWILNSPGIWT